MLDSYDEAQSDDVRTRAVVRVIDLELIDSSDSTDLFI